MMKGIQIWYYESRRRPIAREVMSPRWEHTTTIVLLNGQVTKLPSKYLRFYWSLVLLSVLANGHQLMLIAGQKCWEWLGWTSAQSWMGHLSQLLQSSGNSETMAERLVRARDGQECCEILPSSGCAVAHTHETTIYRNPHKSKPADILAWMGGLRIYPHLLEELWATDGCRGGGRWASFLQVTGGWPHPQAHGCSTKWNQWVS